MRHDAPTLRFAAAFALLASLAFTSDARAQEVLYASTAGGSSASSGTFGDVDQTTGAYTQIGDPTAAGPLPGIAMDSQGRLFGSNNTNGGRTERRGVLIRISPTTGALLDTIGAITDTADAAPLRVSSLAFQPSTDRLFALASNIEKRGRIYTVDTATAAATLVGDTGLDRGGIAFGPNGALYLATARISPDPLLARIDPATGAVIGTPEILESEIEGIAVRPSDGVMFGTGADDRDMYIIDPSTAAMTNIGNDNSSSGHVADLTFLPVPLTVAQVEGFLVPEKLALKLNTKSPERSSLKVKARLDECCVAVEYTQPLALDINGTTWNLPGLTGNAKGTSFKYSDDELKISLRPRQKGSSRGLLSVTLRRDLTGIVTEDGPVAIRLVAGALDVSTTAHLDGRKFRRGRSGAFAGPAVFPLALGIKQNDPDRSVVRVVFGLNGLVGPPGDVRVVVDQFQQLVPGSEFSGSETRPRFSSRSPGVRSIRVDFRRGTVDVSISKATIGYSGGDLVLRLDIAGVRVQTTVTPRAKKSSFTY